MISLVEREEDVRALPHQLHLWRRSPRRPLEQVQQLLLQEVAVRLRFKTIIESATGYQDAALDRGYIFETLRAATAVLCRGRVGTLCLGKTAPLPIECCLPHASRGQQTLSTTLHAACCTYKKITKQLQYIYIHTHSYRYVTRTRFSMIQQYSTIVAVHLQYC